LRLLGAATGRDEADREYGQNHAQSERHEAGPRLAMVEQAKHPDGLLDYERGERKEEQTRIPLPRLHACSPFVPRTDADP
jgi:hypothetical protein